MKWYRSSLVTAAIFFAIAALSVALMGRHGIVAWLLGGSVLAFACFRYILVFREPTRYNAQTSILWSVITAVLAVALRRG